MSAGSGDKVRGLPHGTKTRDELRTLIEKHGFLAESEVLAHINRAAKPVWTHNDFVSFFQKSGQMVFQVINGRLHLALSDHDSSDEEPCDTRGPKTAQSQTQTNGIKNHGDNLSRGVAGLGNNGFGSTSGSSERRKDQRSAARPAPSSSSSDEDNNCTGVSRKPGSSGCSRAQPVSLSRPPPGFARQIEYDSIPFGSEDEEAAPPRLENKEDVVKLVNANRRYYRTPANIEAMVTMDPDPSNKIIPKINLGTGNDDDSSNDSDDESSDSERPARNSRTQPPPVQPVPQASLQGGETRRDDRREAQPSASRTVAPRVLQELNNRRPNFRQEFFTVKEAKDFRESRERDPEKVLKDVVEFGQVSLDDAKRYFDYFLLLQSFSIDCLSNGQVVAGILALIEADPDKEMLQQLRESDEP